MRRLDQITYEKRKSELMVLEVKLRAFKMQYEKSHDEMCCGRPGCFYCWMTTHYFSRIQMQQTRIQNMEARIPDLKKNTAECGKCWKWREDIINGYCEECLRQHSNFLVNG